MKTIVLIAAVAALGACSQEPTAPAPSATLANAEGMTAATPTPTPSPNVASVGTYEVTDADGNLTTETLAADGSYQDMVDGKETETGKWRVDGAKSCFTPEGKSETCVTAEMPGPDGSFDVVGADGKKNSTAKKIA